MPKRIIQDIQPSKRIKEKIRLREKKESRKTTVTTKRPTVKRVTKKTKKSATPMASYSKSSNFSHTKGGYKILWILAALSVIVLVYAISSLFSQAVITVTPQSSTVPIGETFTASRTASSDGALVFDLVGITNELTTEIPTTGTEEVSEKASGTIMVFNNHSSQSQRLIEETRFETADGKVYKLPTGDGITVPGKTGDTPGSIEATVFADVPSESYNLENADFTIPGFKGTPKYENFYARTVTPITGGITGTKNIADEEIIAEAKTRLVDELREMLAFEARAQKTDNFVLYPDAMFFSFANPYTPNAVDTELVTVREEGTLEGILFNKQALSTAIREIVMPLEENPVMVTNLESLDFHLLEKEAIDPQESSEVQFSLSGDPLLVWQFDQDTLIADLAGKRKKDFQTVMTLYPEIDSATLNLKPFWRRSVPDEAKRVRVLVEEPAL